VNLLITGTVDGWTSAQCAYVTEFLKNQRPRVLHGAARGVDSECHDIARWFALPIWVHPGSVKSNLANLDMTSPLCCVEPPAPPLVRNMTMVNRAHLVIAVPRGEEQLRSGTWATIRYARKQGKHLVIVYPSGRVE
jgi:hypothetical protein